MAGTIPISMTQQFNEYGQPLSGGQLYIIQAGTVSTPQDAFQDTGLTIKQPYPMTLDAAGRVPQFFLADGTVKIRLQDKNGVVQLAADSVLVIGPSAGSGTGSTVDPTQLISTGMMMFRHGVGTVAGFVRLNNLTIGSATSGATERSNLDCQALFLQLWPDTLLSVSGGRGVSAAADWTANKQLSLPDWRGYNLSALDDMGNIAANRLGSYFTNPTVLGTAGGAAAVTVLTTNLPPYTPAGTVATTTTATGTSNVQGFMGGSSLSNVAMTGSNNSGLLTIPLTITPTSSSSFTGTAQGGASVPVANISPRKLITFYMKL